MINYIGFLILIVGLVFLLFSLITKINNTSQIGYKKIFNKKALKLFLYTGLTYILLGIVCIYIPNSKNIIVTIFLPLTTVLYTIKFKAIKKNI